MFLTSIISLKFWIVFIFFFNIYLLLKDSRRGLMLAYVVLFNLGFAVAVNQQWWNALVLPVMSILSWGLTRQLQSLSSHRKRQWMLALTIVVTLTPLLYFKYTNFLSSTLAGLFHTNFSPLSLLPPLGISFYTFQAISYAIEGYRDHLPQRVTWLEHLFYLSFFPTVVAGPIVRPCHLIPQLRRPLRVSRTTVNMGLWLIMVGLIKKAVLSDYLAQYNQWIFDDPTFFSGYENAMGVLGYTLQIYLDFSGYSDIAIGLALLLGFQLKDNFNFPYQSSNLTEFWHRWHISLSTWFRDYLYFPLGGNRKGRLRMVLGLLLVMAVSGLWHGASTLFLFWGLLHGVGLVVHKLCRPWLSRLPRHWTIRLLSWSLTFGFLCLTFVFFASPSFDHSLQILRLSLTDTDWGYVVPFFQARTTWCVFLLLGYAIHFLPSRFTHRLRIRFIYAPWLVQAILFAAVIFLIITFQRESVAPFIYAQF